jgi:hypothetical protein
VLVKIKVEGDGPGPSEKIVSIGTTNDRPELLIVSSKIISADAIDVGSPLIVDGDQVLIELPRESTSGRWRIWVPKSEIDSDHFVAAE